MKTFLQFQEEGSHGEKVDGKFMSYATMKSKGIKPKKSALDLVKDKVGRKNIYDPERDKPTDAQKKEYAAHKAKIAKQDRRGPTEKASQGRYRDDPPGGKRYHGD